MSQLVRFERFDSMARAMAEVEEFPQARFALIRYDHIALDLDVACDDRGNKAEILRKELLGERGLLQLAEERGVADDTVLDDLPAAVGKLLGCEGAEATHVGDDDARLPEGACKVLARRKVDGGLSAHRGIDHGQKARGNLGEPYAAHVGRCGEAGYISDHASAKGHDHVFAAEFVFGHELKDFDKGVCPLVLFPRFEHVDARSVARLGEALGHDVRVERPHVRVGDNGGARPLACVTNELAGLLEEHRADMHAIRR